MAKWVSVGKDGNYFINSFKTIGKIIYAIPKKAK